MKVAQLSCVWPPYGGGMGRVAFEYSRILSANYKVTVFTPQYKTNQLAQPIDGVEIVSLKPVLKFGNAAWLPQLPKQLKDFDVIHLHYPFFGVHEFIKALNDQKLIVSYHMTPNTRGLTRFIGSIDSWYSEKMLVGRVGNWIVSSQDYADNIVKPRLGKDVKITILPFGVADEFVPGPASINLRKVLGIEPHDKVILFVGGLDSQHYFKGLPILLKSLPLLQNASFKLIVAGEGNLKSEYQSQASKLKLTDKVKFVGKVSATALPDYYKLADVFALPSINNAEAFGLVTLEAMACGVPAVVTDLPGPRSIVKDTGVGLVAAVNDPVSLAAKIDTLLNNDDLRRDKGTKAARAVEHNYRWSKIGSKLLQLYQEL